MKGKVTCSSCGWSWNKSDSSQKDMYICHECGRDNSNNMKNGGWLDNYGEEANANDGRSSAPDNWTGDGYSNVGRNYSPAWGGQFQEGGKIPKAQGGHLQTINPRQKRGIELLNEESKKAAEDKRELETTGQIKRPRSIAYKSKVKKQPELKQDNRTDYEKGHDERKAKLKKFNKVVVGAADVATDAMQLGNFIPHPAAQLVGKIGNVAGAAVDAYQAGMDFNEGNYGSGAFNLGSAILPSFIEGAGYTRNMYNTNPGSIADKIASLGNRSGSYIPLTTLPRAISPATIKGVTYNRGLLGALGGEAVYDITNPLATSPSQPSLLPPSLLETSPPPIPPRISSDKPIQYYNTNPKYGEVEKPGQSSNVKYVPVSNSQELKQWKKQKTELLDLPEPAGPVTFPIESPSAPAEFAMGGSLPGSPGFTYARTIEPAPDNGPYAKKTMASAQNGQEMSYYQHGLDWKPKGMENGGWLGKYEQAQKGAQTSKSKPAVKFDPKQFAKDFNLNLTPQQRALKASTDKEAQSEDYRRWVSSDEYKKAVKAQKIAEDKATIAQRKANIAKSDKAKLNQWSTDVLKPSNWTRENLADAAAGLGDKARLFPDDPDSFIDEWLNPGVMIGGMAQSLGEAPLQAKETDSYLPYVTAIGAPLLTGALEGLGANTTKQFVNNLINPFNIVPGYKTAEKFAMKKAKDVFHDAKSYGKLLGKQIENQVGNVKSVMSDPNVTFQKPLFLTSKDEVYQNINKGAGVLEDRISTKLRDLQSPEGMSRLVNQEKEYLESIGFTGDLSEQAAKNANARIEELEYMEIFGNKNKNFVERFKQNDFTPSYIPFIHPTRKPTISKAMKAIDIPDVNAYYEPPTQLELTKDLIGIDVPPSLLDPNTISGTRYYQLGEKPKFGNIALGQGMADAADTADHEINHALQRNRVLKIDDELKDLQMDYKKNLSEDEIKDYLYFAYGSGGQESSAFLAEFRKQMLDNGLINHIYEPISPEKVAEAVNQFKQNPVKKVYLTPNGLRSSSKARIANFVRPNQKNFELLSKSLNKLPTVVPGAIGLGAASQLNNEEEVPEYKQGGIIKDDRGQWAHPGEITEIGSNNITMQGVPYDVLGISDTGDTKLMKPGKNYKFKGKKVTEFPMAKNGVNQVDEKTFEQLDQLTNFTNYNTKQPGGWLDKFAEGGTLPAEAASLPAESYDIKEGDTLFEIARDNNVPLNTLANANNLSNPDLIKTGNKLVIPKQYKKELSFAQIPTADNKKVVIDNFSPHYDYIVEGDKTYYKVKSGKTWADISDNKKARENLMSFLDKNNYWAGYGSGEKAKYDKVHHQPVVVPGSKVPRTTPSVIRNTETGNKPTIVKRPISKVVKEEPGFFNEISDMVSSGVKSLENKWQDVKKETKNIVKSVEDSVISTANNAIRTTEDAYQTVMNGVERKYKTYTGDDDDVKVTTKTSPIPKTVKEWYGNKSGAEITQVIDAPNTNGRVYKQQVLPTSNIKFGVRNRGEYKDINTDGLEVTTFNAFSKDPLPDNTTVLAVDPKGNLHTGAYKDFKGQKGYLFSKTFRNNIVDFSEVNGRSEYVSGVASGNPKYQQPKVKVLDDKGKVVNGSLNILVKDDSKKDYYGQVQGGRILFVNPDTKEQYLVSGSMSHIKQKFKELKGNSKYLEAYTLDNGTYSRGLSYKDKKLTKDRLKSYDLENTGGGNGLYILDYKQPVSKYEEDYIDNMPNVRTKNDTSYKKGHPLKNEVKNIVLHHTAYTGPNAEQELNKQYMTPGNNSSHIVIQQNGKRSVYASPEQVTFHAGESEWNKRKDVNDFSIGVEFQGDTNKKPLTQAQIESFVEYYAPLAKKYNLSLKDIITHQMIAPGRKPDINEKQYARILKYMRDKNFK